MGTTSGSRFTLSLVAACSLALGAWPGLASAQDGLSAAAVPPTPRPRGPVRCVDGFAGPYPCRNVDQASYVPNRALGGPTTPNVEGVIGWADEASGRELALVSVSRQVSIVEVTDPENPRLVGDFAQGSLGSVRSLDIFGGHLYVLTGNRSIEILDLSRVLGASGSPVHFTSDGSVRGVRAAGFSINQETGFAYLFFGSPFQPGAITALDLNGDPEAPVEAFTWDPGPSYPNNLECVIYHGADERFTGHEICFGAAPRRSLVIYDVTDKDNPVRLSRTFYRGFNVPWQTALTADHRSLLMVDTHDEHSYVRNTRTFLWDLSSLTEPRQFTFYQGPSVARDRHIEVRGRFAYLANARAGLRVLDLRRAGEGRVREAGYFDMETENDGNDWFGAVQVDVLPSGTVLVGSVRQGLYVLRPRL